MNNQIFFFFYNLSHQSQFLDKLIIFFAVYFPFVVVVLAILFLLLHHEVLLSPKPFTELKKKWREITLVFSSGIIAWILALVFKSVFHTPRPFEILEGVKPLFFELDYAFPSGHATFFSGLAFYLLLAGHKQIGYLLLFFAILISVARVTAGVHFPVDILGGFCLGFIINLFFHLFFNFFKKG